MSMTLSGPRERQTELLSDGLYPASNRFEQTVTMEPFHVLEFSFGSAGSLKLTPPPLSWQIPFIESVCELGTLPKNWNSYRARRVDLKTAAFAIETLLNLLSEDNPMPSIVPTSRGGVLAEWHIGGVDFELDFRSPTWVHVSYEDGYHEFESERANFSVIRDCFERLIQRLS